MGFGLVSFWGFVLDELKFVGYLSWASVLGLLMVILPASLT